MKLTILFSCIFVGNALFYFRDQANASKEGEGRRLSIGSLGVAGIAGISLSSVTATVGSVGKQIGAISGLDIQAQARCSLLINGLHSPVSSQLMGLGLM